MFLNTLLKKACQALVILRMGGYGQAMKRINYAGGTFETGDAVAQAMLDYITNVPQTETNITAEIHVREASGDVATHSIVLGPGTQLDVADAEDASADESTQYPVPDLGKPAELAESEPPADADRAAREFNKAVADIEQGLDDPTT